MRRSRVTRITAFSVALVLLMCIGTSALAMSKTELESALDSAGGYISSAVKSPQVGSIGGEWAVIGLARSGYDVPQGYYDSYYDAVVSYVKACDGVLHNKKYTEYSRVILALTAIGADPTDVGGYNLLTALSDFDKTIWQGINGPTWALIALDSGGYDMPVNSAAAKQATRQMYVDEILAQQQDGGGWSLSGSGTADVDVTAMVLQALSKYSSQSGVQTAIDKGLAWLSAAQRSDGSYDSWGTSNLESVNQVVVALCELGIDLEDSRFVKGGNTLLDCLKSFQQADGSFRHTGSGSGSNLMASEQGLYGLAAASRAMSGSSSLYRMDDVKLATNGAQTPSVGLPGKHKDVKKVAISNPGVTFDDISAHVNQAAIEALAARGIIDGLGDGTFGPDQTMTRAQFAAIVVRALGLTESATDAFTDVAASKWYAPYIGTAHSYKIVNGVGGGKYNPDGTITRQEAATMVMRAVELCGIDTELTAAAIRDMLAQFGDYVTVDSWAMQGLAVCYGNGILNQDDLDIRPKDEILRCEIAQMLFNALVAANLI